MLLGIAELSKVRLTELFRYLRMQGAYHSWIAAADNGDARAPLTSGVPHWPRRRQAQKETWADLLDRLCLTGCLRQPFGGDLQVIHKVLPHLATSFLVGCAKDCRRMIRSEYGGWSIPLDHLAPLASNTEAPSQ